MATGELIILGSGGSSGVPSIGNWWGACDPNEPRNLRTRPSVALKTETTLVIVDAGPDFKDQMNREHLGCPDAIIISHIHSDHINGLEELRMLQRRHKRKFPIYAYDETLKGLQKRLDYMFEETEGGFYPAVLEKITVAPEETLTIGDLEIKTYPMIHGSISALGIRIGDVGYSTDFKSLDEKAIQALKGVKTWIADAAAFHTRENPVHASIEEVIELNEKIGADQVILTHLPPTMDYQNLQKELPREYQPAYDGLRVQFKV